MKDIKQTYVGVDKKDKLYYYNGDKYIPVLDETGGSGGDIELKTINGQSIKGSGNIAITTYQAFPSVWPTDNQHTTKQFCNAIDTDTSAVIGMGYFGGARWSDKPEGLANFDIVVEILEGPNHTKAIHLVGTSSSVYPYRWEYTYWSHGSVSGWRGVQPEIIKNPSHPEVTGYLNEIGLGNTNYQLNLNIPVTVYRVSCDIHDEHDIGHGNAIESYGFTFGSAITTFNELSAELTNMASQASIPIEPITDWISFNTALNVVFQFYKSQSPAIAYGLIAAMMNYGISGTVRFPDPNGEQQVPHYTIIRAGGAYLDSPYVYNSTTDSMESIASLLSNHNVTAVHIFLDINN